MQLRHEAVIEQLSALLPRLRAAGCPGSQSARVRPFGKRRPFAPTVRFWIIGEAWVTFETRDYGSSLTSTQTRSRPVQLSDTGYLCSTWVSYKNLLEKKIHRTGVIIGENVLAGETGNFSREALVMLLEEFIEQHS